MVLKLEQILSSKVAIKLLRFSILKPYLSYGLTELSESLNISKSNILRIANILKKHNLLIEQKKGKKKLYRIDSTNKINKKLFELFNIEKQYNLPSEFKNIIDLFYNEIKTKTKLFIVFGSVAQGIATKESDIDILIIGDKKLKGPIIKHNYRFEVHNYTLEEIKKLSDFIILEAITKGIIYKGDTFSILEKLQFFPKIYLIYRLNKAKEFIKKVEKTKGLAKKYYNELIKITLGEINSLIYKKETIQKRKIKEKINQKLIKNLELELSKRGDKIWLI